MFNIFNNLSTLYNAYKKKPQDLYSGPISSVYKPPVTNGAPRSQMVGGRSVSTTGSTKAPQSYPMPSVNRTTPPPSTPPPTVKPPVAQPTAQQTYEQKYNNYLAQSQARKEQLAQQNEAEAKMKAQEEYDANKTSLTASKGNLDTMMSGFRQRAATGQARLDTQAQQNRDRTNVTAGENQRQLAIDRRDARNDNEKRYAALGTIDSMGTGSFQSANENTESDFLSLTAKNKQATQYAIQDIDNKLFEAKASSEERIATEESKYNDAILEIEKLLAGNETGKAQAIRAASQLLAQKKAEIMDEYEGLRITSEKEKYDLQAKLEAAAMDDQKLRTIFAEASPDFLKTGQPKTAQDQFIIMKYPKEMETYSKMINPTSKNKPTEKQAQFANAAKSGEYALNLLSSGKVNTGIGQDVLGSYQEKWGGGSDTQQDYRSTIAAARTLARNAMLGANMTPKEMESLSALIPEYNDDINIAKQKLTTFVREMNRFANMDVQMQSGLTPEMIQGLQAFEK